MVIEGFDWDDAKAESNYRKHGVDFETATEVFADPLAVDRFDEDSAGFGEYRFLITGMAGGKLVTVVYTEYEKRIRIISARRASRPEHDNYYRQNPQA